MGRKLKPVSPGEMPAEEFLKPQGMSNCRLAKEIDVPAQRIGELIAGKRAVGADTDLRLSRFFGLSDGWWLRLQADFDTGITKATLARSLAKIKPWSVRDEGKAPANGCIDACLSVRTFRRGSVRPELILAFHDARHCQTGRRDPVCVVSRFEVDCFRDHYLPGINRS